MDRNKRIEGNDKFSNSSENREFVPPFFLMNPVFQTVLSSMKIRNRGRDLFDEVCVEKIIEAGNDVKLAGYYSEYRAGISFYTNDDSGKDEHYEHEKERYQEINSGNCCGANKDCDKENKKNDNVLNQFITSGADNASNSPSAGKGKLLILLHGWEGSEKSAYLSACGRYFYKLGYSIFRLNMRDHGNSHHLNEGLFNGTLIDEAYNAVKKVVSCFGADSDIFIAGFSMGANFALRIAYLAGQDKDMSKSLKKVIAVNPPLNPHGATKNIDRTFIIKKYFLRKWRKSLARKEAAFPDLYSFSEFSHIKSCIKLTGILIAKHTDYMCLEDYFSRYTLKKDFFAGIRVPVFIITAKDDPVIDVSDFSEIAGADNSYLDLCVEDYGGHCAYIKNIKLDTWLFDKMNSKMMA